MSSLRWVAVDWHVNIHVGMMSTIIETLHRSVVPRSVVPRNFLTKCTEPQSVSVRVVRLLPRGTNTVGQNVKLPPISLGT